MVDAGTELRSRIGPNHVAFRGVQVSAGWIDAQRPMRLSVTLPRRNGQRVSQQAGEGIDRDKLGNNGLRIENLTVRWQILHGQQRQSEERRIFKTTKRIGLRIPVQITERARESMIVMLRSFVVNHDRIHCRQWFVAGWRWRHGNGRRVFSLSKKGNFHSSLGADVQRSV